MLNSLNTFNVGDKCKIVKLLNIDSFNPVLLDMGIIDKSIVEVIRKSPFGGSMEVCVKGSNIVIRFSELNNIICEKI